MNCVGHLKPLPSEKLRREEIFKPFLPISHQERTRKRERDQNNKMTKKNNQSFQIALNMFKMSELNFKNQLDLLQTAISQRKSFRTLTLLINNIKETKEELRKAAEKVFLKNPHPSTVSSITERHSNLLSKLQIFEHEVNSLDDDGQLSQSSTQLRDDISVSSKCSSRLLESNRSSPTRTEKSTQAVEDNNIALLQPPPIPPRKKPSLFLPTNSNTQPLLSKFLRTSQTSAKNAKANQQLDTSTSLFAFDTIQTEELNPNASEDIILPPTKQPIDVSFEFDVTSNKKFVVLPKIQPSTATRKTFDTKQHNNNIPNTKQKAEHISGYSKNNVEPNITRQ